MGMQTWMIVFLLLFSHHSYQMTLDCSFDSGPFYSIIGNPYRCKVEDSTKVESEYKIVERINGVHQDTNSNDACQMMWVWGTIFHYIPRGIGDHFGNLEAIWVHYGGLKELSNLEQFPSLRYIYARHNQLQELRSDVFKNNPYMEWLDLKYNNLVLIDGQIFLPFANMTNLNLKYNYCIDEHYHAKFRTLSENQTQLHLWNIVHNIDVNCHWPDEIFCAMDDISHQGEKLFTCSGKGTNITEANTTLPRILFNRNQTQNNETEGFLVRNQVFYCFPLNFHILLPNLKAIQVVNSGLKKLSKEILENFPELKSLWLPLNEIETLEENIFEKNTKLEKLSLYQNNLKIIKARVLMPLKNLKFVSFERNICTDMAATTEDLNEFKNEVAIKCDPNQSLEDVDS